MASSRLFALLMAQGLVAGGAAAAVVAAKSGLPASALLAAVVAALAAAWTIANRRHGLETSSDSPPRNAARLEQERQRRTLQVFLDQAPTPLVTLAPGGALTAVNRAARRFFRTDATVADPAGALHAAMEAASPATRSRVRLAADGQARLYALSVADVVGAGGSLRLAALTDIQADIQAAEAAALKELLQVLSHEIMNSLTPLVSLSQSAADLLEDPTPASLRQAQGALGVVARRTERLQHFVEAYRQLARLPDPVPRLTSLGGLLRESVDLFAARWQAQGVACDLDLPVPDILIRLDPDLTSQALLNLLTNAAEASLASRDGPPRVTVSGRASGDGIAIVVSDNGPGVEPDAAQRIFRPFFTTKAGGSGVGLSLAHQAVASQGGDLVLAASAPGRGAQFAITL